MLGRIAEHWGCKAFELATNYRCAEPIVAASRLVIGGGAGQLRLAIGEGALTQTSGGCSMSSQSASSSHAPAPPGAPPTGAAPAVRLMPCADRAAELLTLARELSARQRATAAPSGSVAVLCRLRVEVAQVRKALREFGVLLAASDKRDSAGPCSPLGLLSFLRLVSNPKDDQAFADALHIHAKGGAAFGPKGAALQYLRAGAPKQGGLLHALLAAQERGYSNIGGLTLSRPSQSALTQFLEMMNELRTHVTERAPIEIPTLLSSLASRVAFDTYLQKQKARSTASRTAFTVRIRGEPSPRHDAASTDDSSDGDESDEDGEGGKNTQVRTLGRVA